jgi:hypothetical protein
MRLWHKYGKPKANKLMGRRSCATDLSLERLSATNDQFTPINQHAFMSAVVIIEDAIND